MLKLLSAAPLLWWAINPALAHDWDVSGEAFLHAPIAAQSASSRYEKKDPQEFSREQIAKDRDVRHANEQPTSNGKDSTATGASDGAQGNSGFGAEAR